MRKLTARTLRKISFVFGLLITLWLFIFPEIFRPLSKVSSFVLDKPVVVAYINGLNTPFPAAYQQRQDLEQQIVNQAFVRFPEVNFNGTASSFVDRYELFHNPAQEDFELGQRGQFIASIALKIIEANPAISMDEAWQLTRLFLQSQYASTVIEASVRDVTIDFIGIEIGLGFTQSDVQRILEGDAFSQALTINEAATKDAYRNLKLETKEELKENKILLVSHSQGTIYSTLLLNDPEVRNEAPNGNPKCFLSTLQVANMSLANTTVKRNGVSNKLYVTSAEDLVVKAVDGAIRSANAVTIIPVPPPGTTLEFPFPLPPAPIIPTPPILPFPIGPIGDVIPGVPILIIPEPPNVSEPRTALNDTGHGFIQTYTFGPNARPLFVEQIGWAIENLISNQCFTVDFELTPLATVTPQLPPPRPTPESCEPPPPPQAPPPPPPPPTPFLPVSFEHGIPYKLEIKIFDSEGERVTEPLLNLFDINVAQLNPDSRVEDTANRDIKTVSLTKDLGTLELEIQVTAIGSQEEDPVKVPLAREDTCNLRGLDNCFEDEDPPSPLPCPTPPPPPPSPGGSGSSGGGGSGGGGFGGGFSAPAAAAGSTPACTTCNNGSSSGDPHLVTLDGLYYNYQGKGEYLLALSDDGQIEIQTRQEPWINNLSPELSNVATANTAVAARLGENIVGIYLDPAKRFMVNGEVINLGINEQISSGDGYFVERRQAGGDEAYYLGFPTGEQIEIYVRERFSLLDLRLLLSPNLRLGRMSGLLGNYDGIASNDIRTRAGEALSSRPLSLDDLYNRFGNSWRISQDESLFVYNPGESTAIFTDLFFPPNLLSISPEQRTSAENTCRARGITDPILLEICVFDLLVTGQIDIGVLVKENFETGDKPTEFLDLGSLVNTLADENGENPESCSLREAIVANNLEANFGGCSNPQGRIQFDSNLVVDTITIVNSPLPTIVKSLAIQNLDTKKIAVSGDEKFRIFDIKDANFSIEGLILTQAKPERDPGGAIRLQGSRQTLTIANSIISGNIGGKSTNIYSGIRSSGALAAVGSTVNLNNSIITGNKAQTCGAINAFEVTANDSQFIENGGGYYYGYRGRGGAICGDTVTITNSSFTGNSVAGLGGAVFSSSKLIVTNSKFQDNVVTNDNGNGGAIFSPRFARVAESEFVGNNSTRSGGAIHANSLIVEKSNFVNNLSSFSNGGAIYSRTSVTVSDSTFTGNTARFGGAIGARDVELSKSAFNQNTAKYYGGGAVSAFIVSVESSTFSKNIAGTRTNFTQPSERYGGGAIYATTISMANSVLSENIAVTSSGGALQVSKLAVISDSQFVDNLAEKGGGAIDLLATDSGFTKVPAQAVIRDSQFSGNTAAIRGGGISNITKFPSRNKGEDTEVLNSIELTNNRFGVAAGGVPNRAAGIENNVDDLNGNARGADNVPGTCDSSNGSC